MQGYYTVDLERLMLDVWSQLQPESLGEKDWLEVNADEQRKMTDGTPFVSFKVYGEEKSIRGFVESRGDSCYLSLRGKDMVQVEGSEDISRRIAREFGVDFDSVRVSVAEAKLCGNVCGLIESAAKGAVEDTYSNLEMCADCKWLKENLSGAALRLIDDVLDAYWDGKIDLFVPRDKNEEIDWSQAFAVVVQDDSYIKVGTEAVDVELLVMKWVEGFEDTGNMAEVIESFVYHNQEKVAVHGTSGVLEMDDNLLD